MDYSNTTAGATSADPSTGIVASTMHYPLADFDLRPAELKAL